MVICFILFVEHYPLCFGDCMDNETKKRRFGIQKKLQIGAYQGVDMRVADSGTFRCIIHSQPYSESDGAAIR